MKKIIKVCMCLIGLVEAFALGVITTMLLVGNVLGTISKDTKKHNDYDDYKNRYRHY